MSIRQKIERWAEFFLFEKIHYTLMLILAYFILVILFRIVIIPKLAVYRAENPENIKTACLFLLSKDYKYKKGWVHTVELDRTEYSTDEGILRWYLWYEKEHFPFNRKANLFWDSAVTKKNKCYSVKYIQVNLGFTEYIYLYDAEIPPEFYLKEHQPIRLEYNKGSLKP